MIKSVMIYRRSYHVSRLLAQLPVKTNDYKNKHIEKITYRNDSLSNEEMEFRPRLEFNSQLVPTFKSIKIPPYDVLKTLLPLYKQCQFVIEIRDVRTPFTSKNVMFDLLGLKSVTKADIEKYNTENESSTPVSIEDMLMKQIDGNSVYSGEEDKSNEKVRDVEKLIVYTFGDYLNRMAQESSVSRKLVIDYKKKLNFYHKQMNENYMIIDGTNIPKSGHELRTALRTFYYRYVNSYDNVLSPIGFNCLITGIPNVGKSNVINIMKHCLDKKEKNEIKKVVKSKNFSGTTRNASGRIRVDDFLHGIYVIDTPGLSMPPVMYDLDMRMALAMNSEQITVHSNSDKSLKVNDIDEIMELDFILYLINLLLKKEVIKNDLGIPLVNDVWELLEWYWQNVLLVDINNNQLRRSQFEHDINSRSRVKKFMLSTSSKKLNQKVENTKHDIYLNWQNIAHHLHHYYLRKLRGLHIPCYDISFWLGVNEEGDPKLKHFKNFIQKQIKKILKSHPEIQIELMEASVDVKTKLKIADEIKRIKRKKNTNHLPTKFVESIKTKHESKKKNAFMRAYNKVLYE